MLLWLVSVAFPAELAAALVLCCCAWPLPAATLTGDCVDVALLAPFCSAVADCTTVCDWPQPGAPALCTWLLLWLVVLSFVDDDVASFELVCTAPGGESSAAAIPARASPSATAAIEQSSARQHRMPPVSA